MLDDWFCHRFGEVQKRTILCNWEWVNTVALNLIKKKFGFVDPSPRPYRIKSK
jgi:hypothetical protein